MWDLTWLASRWKYAGPLPDGWRAHRYRLPEQYRGLFVAGEDASGVHGANRLGGNGVGCSTVFGGIAGDGLAAYIARAGSCRKWRSRDQAHLTRVLAPFERSQGEDVYVLRDELKTLMWEQAGLVRHAASLAGAEGFRDAPGAG